MTTGQNVKKKKNPQKVHIEKQTLQKVTFNFQYWKPALCFGGSNCGTPELDCKHPTAPLCIIKHNITEKALRTSQRVLPHYQDRNPVPVVSWDHLAECFQSLVG